MEFILQYLASALGALEAEPVASALALLSFALLVSMWLLSRRLSRLTQGGDGKTLEGTIRALDERAGKLEIHAKKTELALENLDGRLATSVRGVAIERFDPFHEQSGRQSFVTAFLNEQGDGVVVSGIHSRDSVRVYAKDLKAFKSERELSEEEQKAIKRAQNTLT
ncbi:MAG: DUF4446 family protein [Candidatus Paceibacteria bacterium]